MAIRLETSKRRGVDNHQDSEISDSDLRWYRQLSKLHPNAIQRTQPSPLFNCHGLTFASRRSKVLDLTNIFRILEDDAWRETSMTKVLPGDIVIYFDNEGDANHSGVVVQYSQEILVPLICSKWGSGPEYIHKLSDVPNVYGPYSILPVPPMTKLTKSQLQEITNIYLLANTPKSLLRALLKTSVVDALRRDCSTEELFHSYNRITTKAKRSPFVAALAYCSLIALLVKAPAKSECPDASYLQWGTIIESHLAREFGTTETVIITSNSPNPTVRLVSTGGMPLRSTQDSPTKPTTQFFS